MSSSELKIDHIDTIGTETQGGAAREPSIE
jgi:hypothetical protein